MGDNHDDKPPEKALQPVFDLFPEFVKGSKTIRERLLADPLLVDPDGPILFQHSVLCQTCLPFRDPGNEVRQWEHTNGLVNLLLAAAQAFHPDARRFVDVGLPFGPKPRLVLYHLNAEALRTQSPEMTRRHDSENYAR